MGNPCAASCGPRGCSLVGDFVCSRGAQNAGPLPTPHQEPEHLMDAIWAEFLSSPLVCSSLFLGLPARSHGLKQVISSRLCPGDCSKRSFTDKGI